MGYATQVMMRSARRIEAAIPSAVFSGIAPSSWDAYGFHNSPNNLVRAGRSRDYSLVSPGNMIGESGVNGEEYNGMDMSMNTRDMIQTTNNVYRSWKDPNDERLNYFYEGIGTLNGMSVIYMNFQTGDQGTADFTHLWHFHRGGLRKFANSEIAEDAWFSAFTGEPIQAWRDRWKLAPVPPVSLPKDPTKDDDMTQDQANQLALVFHTLMNIGRDAGDGRGLVVAPLHAHLGNFMKDTDSTLKKIDEEQVGGTIDYAKLATHMVDELIKRAKA